MLLERGRVRIVNIGAGAAIARAGAGIGAYTASKAGVQKLTESLAEELKDRGITVNAILPGTIDTPRNRRTCRTRISRAGSRPRRSQTSFFSLPPTAARR